MNENISNLIEDVLTNHDISLLFAVESGSRAYGFESPDSDFDIRGVYIRPVKAYLKLVEGGDQLSYTDKELGLDLVLWDLKKALKLITVSNPSVLDWLSSPIVYLGSSEPFLPIAKYYFDPARYLKANFGLASQHYHKYIKDKPVVENKVYLYTLRALAACRYILRSPEPFAPPVNFSFAEEFTEPEIVTKLVLEKRAKSEAASLEPNLYLNDLIVRTLDELRSLEWTPRAFVNNDRADEFFLDSFKGAVAGLVIGVA
jgi:uncharacterized protein